ncbi:MAG TPA: tRNA pseudouridine(55) synthase TruB [Phycisphaerae bacterium]|nr:tRNA pseudouridine(55) synthase TruB [Phycisphaerae bacterium]
MIPHHPADPPDLPAGLVNLYKPVGKSSANYVYRLRPIFGLKKVGHAGTLDPFADGVLIACIGKGTRLVERLMELPKRYRTTLRLGVTNETFDTERPADPVAGATPPPIESIRSVLRRLTGEIQQVPPAFSAMRVGGVLSYKLAKKGRAVPHAPRPITIYGSTIEDYAWPLLSLDINCGRGTYIRAMARDLGDALGCGAICEQLRREAIGPFTVDDSIRLDQASPEAVRAALIAVPDAIARIEAYAPPPLPQSP